MELAAGAEKLGQKVAADGCLGSLAARQQIHVFETTIGLVAIHQKAACQQLPAMMASGEQLLEKADWGTSRKMPEELVGRSRRRQTGEEYSYQLIYSQSSFHLGERR